MKRGKTHFVVCTVLLWLIVVVLGACGVLEKGVPMAEASDIKENQDSIERSIFTSLSISINGENGKVWTTVRNDVTIFPATVVVIVELYSSETLQESHQNMKLERTVQIGDLDLGKTITAEASTGGVQKYWQGRTRFKVDKGAWKEMKTGICLFDANGNFISYA